MCFLGLLLLVVGCIDSCSRFVVVCLVDWFLLLGVVVLRLLGCIVS